MNPAFLWGALAASIPVIIHLINRRRARVVRFPAVKFVLRAERRVARKYRVKQWLLLALRTMLLFLLTTALAEPVLQPRESELTEIKQARAVAIILDNSLSMAYQHGGTSRWELAKEAAISVLQTLRPQDQSVVLPLLSLDDPPQSLSADHARLVQRVSELSRTYESGGFVIPFQHAYALLKQSNAPKREIIAITDGTRTPWVGFEPAALKAIDPQIRVTVIAVGGKGNYHNTTVREVRLEGLPVVAGVRTRLTASIITFGLDDRQQVPVRLMVDGRTLDQRLVDLSKGGATDLSFEVIFDQPGYREGAISLAHDGLASDDTFYFTVPVRKILRVLLIDGDPRTTLVGSETYYLMNALNPGRMSRLAPLQPRVVPVEEAENLRLSDFEVVLLANVRTLSSSFRARLMEFVNQGGGLWWFLGDHVAPAVYNRELFDIAERLLPARLGPRLDRVDAHPVTLRPEDIDHPMLQPLADQVKETLAAVRVRRLLTTEMASLPPTTRPLLTLPGGLPLLLEGEGGRGRVLMFTSTADVDWNELPVTTAYLPLIQLGVIYLAGLENNQRIGADVRIPQPIRLMLSESQKGALIAVSDPQGRETQVYPQEQEARGEVHYPHVRMPGFYPIRVGQERAVVAVNPSLEESDLTPIEPAELQEKLPGIPFALVHWERGEPLRPAGIEPMSLAAWFLTGLLLLMLIEGVFANRLR